MPKPDRKSLNHGAGRVARLARWLDQPRPKESKYNILRLEVRVEGEWSPMQAWPASDVQQYLAETIDEIVRDYANEQGTFTVARLVWWSEELRAAWTSYDLRVAPEDTGNDAGQSFSGDVQSTNIQTQRHLEFMMRQHLGGMACAMQTLRETQGLTASQLADALTQLGELRQRVHDLERENLELQNQLDQALTSAEAMAEAKEEADEQSNVIQLVTTAMKRQQEKKPS